MDPVGHLGPGPNQLLTVVAEGLQVLEQVVSVRGGKFRLGGHHPGDGYRVDGIGLPVRGPAPALPVGEGPPGTSFTSSPEASR
jgi:hypothetical protein